MRCPFCQNPDTQVVDSRAPEDGCVIRRRRRCPVCSRRFTTFERANLPIPSIVKRSGVRVEFSREKLRNSMMIALRKRSVPQEKIEEALDVIERAMILTGERDVPSRFVGELVLGTLEKLDAIAYVRFASVYYNIDDPQSFISMVENAKVPNGSTDGAMDVLQRYLESEQPERVRK